MANWAEEVFAPIEAHYKAAVIQDTWGHLAPKKNTTYRGDVLVSSSGYSTGIQLVDMNWDHLQDNPWVYEKMQDWLYEQRKILTAGTVWTIKVTMRNYRIWGQFTKIFPTT